jgi:hypothetical protein
MMECWNTGRMEESNPVNPVNPVKNAFGCSLGYWIFSQPFFNHGIPGKH